MNGNNIRELINRFLDGTLDASEEARLRDLLKKDDSPSNAVLKKYFQWIEAEKSLEYSVREPEMLTGIEQKQKSVVLKSRWLKIAASIVLIALTGIFWWIYHGPTTKEKYTETEKQRSIQATKLALASMSDHWNKGIKKINNGVNFSRPFDHLEKLKKSN